MKIEIDLNQIFGDENGVETLSESVTRQVTERISKEVRSGIGSKIDVELSKLINETIKTALHEFMPSTINELMTSEYVTVDRYGDRSRERTTFRKELVRAIQEQMVYKKSNYSSDENAFTKAVDSVIKDNVNEFKKNFDCLVNQTFTKECFEYAKTELQKKLGIK